MAATLTFSQAAGAGAQAVATTGPAGPDKIICARVAVRFDEVPASSGKAGAILRRRKVPPLAARHRQSRLPVPAEASPRLWRKRTVRPQISRAFEIREYRDGQRCVPEGAASPSTCAQAVKSSH